MNEKQLRALHNTLCGKIGINHDFQIQIDYDNFKQFISDIFSNQENFIQHVKERLFTTQRERDRHHIRPDIHVIPRFIKDEDLINFNIEIELDNKLYLTNTESISFVNMCNYISKIGAMLVKLGNGGSMKPGYEYFYNLFIESFTDNKSNIEENLENISSIDFNSFDTSILDTNIELNSDLFDEKIININKIYQKNKILYFINFFYRIYDITAHISIVENKLKELTLKYIQLLETPNDRELWIFLFNYFKLHPFYSGNGKIGRFLLNLYFIKHYNFYIDISIPENENFFDDILSILIFKNYLNNYVVNDNCIKLLLNNKLNEYKKESHNIFKCSESIIDEIIEEFNLLEKTNITESKCNMENSDDDFMTGGNNNLMNGGAFLIENNNYKNKYLKYKLKYIKLKKNI
jgi:hypothetical protein